MRMIEKRPPVMTDDALQNTKALADYLAYLREDENFHRSLLAKELEHINEGGAD